MKYLLSLFSLLLLLIQVAAFSTKLRNNYSKIKYRNELLMINNNLKLIAPIGITIATFSIFPIDISNRNHNQPINTITNLIVPRVNAADEYVTLPSGVQYYDAVVGTGDEVTEGKTVQFLWVLRRSNGYFVDSSSNYDNEPFIYRVGNTKKVIKGLDEAIRGMKVNGIRRVNIPPTMGFVEGVEDGKPGPLPAGFGPKRQILTRLDRETWVFEIKILKVK